MLGARITRESVMPVNTVMFGGIAHPGLTRVWKVPITSPARTLTAPISVMKQVWGLPPVVSTSKMQNVTSCNGVPRSSKDRWEEVRTAPFDIEHVFEVKCFDQTFNFACSGRWNTVTKSLTCVSARRYPREERDHHG